MCYLDQLVVKPKPPPIKEIETLVRILGSYEFGEISRLTEDPRILVNFIHQQTRENHDSTV